MERYETARITMIQIEEDVIAASIVRCEYYENDAGSTDAYFIVYYSDETTAEYGADFAPEECY